MVTSVESLDTSQIGPKFAVVIGGSSGIGEYVARALAAEGYDVHSVARNVSRLHSIAAEIGGTYQIADLAEPQEVLSVVRTLQERRKVIDAFIYTAGLYERAPIRAHPQDLWDKMMAINVGAAFTLSSQLVPLFRSGSHVIFMSSTATTNPAPTFGAYSASKAALEAFAETFGAELEPLGIHVHVVVPGPTATPMQSRGLAKFLMQPERVASTVTWLLNLPNDIVLRRVSLRPVVSGPFASPRG